MTQRHVLQGDRRRPEEHGAEEGPEPYEENHRGPPASGLASEPRLYRIRRGGGEGSLGGTRRWSSRPAQPGDADPARLGACGGRPGALTPIVTASRRSEIDWLYRGVAPLFPAQRVVPCWRPYR